MLRPLAGAVSSATVLGDPDSRPWDDLAAIGAAEIERGAMVRHVLALEPG